MNNCTRVTDPPEHHFFGYYEKSPWNADESFLLTHETTFQDRRPTAEDTAGICVIDDATGDVERVAETRAWDFQQGSMLQWLGPEYERRFVFNDRDEDGFVARIHDIETGHVRTIDHPIYAVAPDGETAYTLDYDRLEHTRPGYGYAPIDEGRSSSNSSAADDDPVPAHPDTEGVYSVDLTDGSSDLLVSLADLATFDPVPEMDHGTHWVNHIQIAPSGERLAFIHRWKPLDGDRGRDERLLVADIPSDELSILAGPDKVSHYDWRTDDELVAWTHEPSHGKSFYQKIGENAPSSRSDRRERVGRR